jgi:hypothetical protein
MADRTDFSYSIINTVRVSDAPSIPGRFLQFSARIRGSGVAFSGGGHAQCCERVGDTVTLFERRLPERPRAGAWESKQARSALKQE